MPWELFKKFLAFALLGYLALFYLGHLIAFSITGPVTVGEPNKVLLWIEIIAFISVGVLAIDCFLGELAIIMKIEPKNKEDKKRFNPEDGSN